MTLICTYVNTLPPLGGVHRRSRLLLWAAPIHLGLGVAEEEAIDEGIRSREEGPSRP
jgi:hypothetical protein